MNKNFINFKTAGLLILAIAGAAELSHAYSVVGWEVLYIILPIGGIIGATIYVRNRFKNKF